MGKLSNSLKKESSREEILERKNNSHKKDSKFIRNRTQMKTRAKKTTRRDLEKKSRTKTTMIVIFEGSISSYTVKYKFR
jgi:hypothetical protein